MAAVDSMESNSEEMSEQAMEIEMETKQDPAENDTKSSNSSAKITNNDRKKRFMDRKSLKKWDRMAMILAFTALMSLLSVSYFSITNDRFFPKTFHKQSSYVMFLMVINAAFYFPITGFILRKKHPNIGKVFSVIAFLGVVVSFTLLSSILLPSYLNWVPWVLGIVTVGALVYQLLPHSPRNCSTTCNI